MRKKNPLNNKKKKLRKYLIQKQKISKRKDPSTKTNLYHNSQSRIQPTDYTRLNRDQESNRQDQKPDNSLQLSSH